MAKSIEEMTLKELWDHYEVVADQVVFSSAQVEVLKRRGEDSGLEYQRAVEHMRHIKREMAEVEHELGL